jgi:hypothetical protein
MSRNLAQNQICGQFSKTFHQDGGSRGSRGGGLGQPVKLGLYSNDDN